MGFRLNVTGLSNEIAIDERAITKVVFDSDTPDETNARATDFALSVKVWGRMLYTLEAAAPDPTLDLALWSQVPSSKSDCYRNLKLDVIAASQTVRQFTLPQAFVMEYEEFLDDEKGVGTFYLHAKQKKDENAGVKIEGGFAADE